MQSLRGITYALVSSATFGLIPLFAVPPVKAGMDINSLVFYRFLVSSIGMGAVMLIQKKSISISLKEFMWMFLLSIFYAATSILLTSSYFYVPSGIATTIHFLYPVVVTLVMTLAFKEKSSRWLYIAIAMAILGVYLLSDTAHTGNIPLKGFVLVFSTVITYAAYLILVNRIKCVREMEGTKATFWVLTIGMMIFFANVMLNEGRICAIPDIRSGIDIIMLGLVATLISDLMLILAIQKIGSTTSAILGCMEPLTAVTTGIMFLGETASFKQMAGLITVIMAVTLVIYTKKETVAEQKVSA